MSDGLDKMMYSFVMEDVLKGFFIHVPLGYVAAVYDLGRGVLKKIFKPVVFSSFCLRDICIVVPPWCFFYFNLLVNHHLFLVVPQHPV